MSDKDIGLCGELAELTKAVDELASSIASRSRDRLRAEMAATILGGMLARGTWDEKAAVERADKLLAELGL